MITRNEPNFPVVLSGLSFQPDHFVMQSNIILASRVDQELCDKAEHGQVNGLGTIMDGCWILQGGRTRIHLNKGYQLSPETQIYSDPFDFFPGGEPLIEECISNAPRPFNGNIGKVQFLYLWASCGAQQKCFRSWVGLSNKEIAQATVLGSKWNLNGNWGSTNRLAGESNWHEDASLLTTAGDSNGKICFVYDVNKNPQYAVEIIRYEQYSYLLPFRYLKRVGFWGPRRVFFPPEENIAIWYLRPPNVDVKDVILSATPHLMFECDNSHPEVIFGCLPGGTPSISKTDLASLRGKRCWIPIFSKHNKQEVEFAVSFFARLRREYMTPHILFCDKSLVNGNSLTTLAQLADMHELFVPEELQNEYLGELTETIMNDSVVPVIEGVLHEGEAVLIREHDLPPFLLASYVASRATCGHNVFGEYWRMTNAAETIMFIDDYSRNLIARYKPGCRVYDVRLCTFSPEERKKAFCSFIATAKLVIFAAHELLSEHADVCVEMIRICLSQRIEVMIFSEEELPRKLERLMMKTIVASRLAGKNALTISLIGDGDTVPLEVGFDTAGNLLSAQVLSKEKQETLGSFTSIPSLPPDHSKMKAIAENLHLERC